MVPGTGNHPILSERPHEHPAFAKKKPSLVLSPLAYCKLLPCQRLGGGEQRGQDCICNCCSVQAVSDTRRSENLLIAIVWLWIVPPWPQDYENLFVESSGQQIEVDTNDPWKMWREGRIWSYWYRSLLPDGLKRVTSPMRLNIKYRMASKSGCGVTNWLPLATYSAVENWSRSTFPILSTWDWHVSGTL